MAELMDGRLELQALTAGVFEATVDGVICGVGSGPMRASAGVGGARSGFGSKKRGKAVIGVGVLTCDVESTAMGCDATRETGVVICERSLLTGHCGASAGLLCCGIGTLSSSGVKTGIKLFQVIAMPCPGEGGCMLGVYRSTMSVHRLKTGSAM